MHPSLVGGSCLIAVYIAYRFLSWFISSRRHARNAVKLGCKPPPLRPYRLPFGIDMLQRMIKADGEKRVPDLMLDIYEEMGRKHTWLHLFFGMESIWTVDPINIQAILATQFQEFVLGETRRNNFFPLLGNGIFTTDGRAWCVIDMIYETFSLAQIRKY